MALAACARQSAPSGLKGRSDPTIGCGDIEYLPIDRPGGKAAARLCGVVFGGCARSGKKKKKDATGGGPSSEKRIIF